MAKVARVGWTDEVRARWARWGGWARRYIYMRRAPAGRLRGARYGGVAVGGGGGAASFI